MPIPLILASGSETRARLLAAAGVEFVQKPVRLDEEALRQSLEADGATHRDMADVLAEAKARKASQAVPDALSLGSDQILSFGDQVLTKPVDREDAAKQLSLLSGKRHTLFSAAVIYENAAPVWRHVGVAHLTMRKLSPEDIKNYLDRAWPDIAGSVGCYHLEGLGVQLFDRVDGDMFTIQGLPLIAILSFLRIRGQI